jgi:ribokinase
MHESISVVVVGSCNVDLNSYMTRVPEAGETVIGESFETRMGGKGANQAVAAARFGSSVAMIGAVGTDSFGDLMISNFGIEGVNTHHVSRIDGASGIAAIWISADGENRIVVISGANSSVSAAQAEAALAEFPAAKVVLGQLEISQGATLAAFKQAKARGLTTVLNPAPIAELAVELMAATDWLIVNEIEFAQLHAAGREPSEPGAVSELAEQTGCRVVVTLGAAGVLLGAADGQVDQIAAPAVSAVDTVGAGDCFTGAFAHGLAHGLDEREAVEVAVRAASLSVQRRGAQSSFPSRNEAREILSLFGA